MVLLNNPEIPELSFPILFVLAILTFLSKNILAIF